MKTLTSLFMALLFCFGCSQSKDMYPIDVIKIDPIDVIKIDPIPPLMDMTSTVDSGIKCGARELKTDEGCVPCSVIVPDDYPTINQAVGKGDVVCVRDGVYKEDVFINASVKLHGQSMYSNIQGKTFIGAETVNLSIKNLAINSLTTPSTFNKIEALSIEKVIFSYMSITQQGYTNFGFTLKNSSSNGGIALDIHTYINTQTLSIDIKNNTLREVRVRYADESKLKDNPIKTFIVLENNVFQEYNTAILLWNGTLDPALQTKLPNINILNNTFTTTTSGDLSTAFREPCTSKCYLTPYIKMFNNLYTEGKLYTGYLAKPIEANNMRSNKDYFVNYDAGNFRLKSTSPAVDAATSDLYPKMDKSGKLRPIDGKLTGKPLPDVGAYEYDPKDTK
jgi:hypothetical protein